MSFVLPKEVRQQKKLNSLPDDLRTIAEKLISSKFEEVEVMEKQSPASFRQEYPGAVGQGLRGAVGAGFDELSGQQSVPGYGYGIRDNSWDGISITKDYTTNSHIISIPNVSERTLLTVMNMLHMNNFRRRKSVLYTTYEDLRVLYNSTEFRRYNSGDDVFIGNIYEFEVRLERGQRQSYIKVYY